MQLHRKHPDIQRADGRVALVSFAAPEQARAWQQETTTPFPVLLDSGRSVYQAYGFERSVRRSWNLRTIWKYIQLLAGGRRWRGIQGDSAQLGGDLILDRNGIVRFAHYSNDPTDRPPVDLLLEVLQGIRLQHSGYDSPLGASHEPNR